MYAFYLPRGHSLSELESLHPLEKNFYIAAQEEYYTNLFEVIGVVLQSVLGDGVEEDKKSDK